VKALSPTLYKAAKIDLVIEILLRGTAYSVVCSEFWASLVKTSETMPLIAKSRGRLSPIQQLKSNSPILRHQQVV